MTDCRDYRDILLGESLDSNDSSSDYEPSGESLDGDDSSSDWEPSREPSGETLGSQDTWSSQSSEDSSQDSSLVASQERS